MEFRSTIVINQYRTGLEIFTIFIIPGAPCFFHRQCNNSSNVVWTYNIFAWLQSLHLGSLASSISFSPPCLKSRHLTQGWPFHITTFFGNICSNWQVLHIGLRIWYILIWVIKYNSYFSNKRFSWKKMTMSGIFSDIWRDIQSVE